ESGPARPRSVWADMVVSGADDHDEPEPGPGPGAVPEPETEPWAGREHQAPQDGVPNWPASGLPPSFGQRSTEGEWPPAVAPPAPGSGHGGYRPLGSLPPSGPPPISPLPGAAWHQAGDD